MADTPLTDKLIELRGLQAETDGARAALRVAEAADAARALANIQRPGDLNHTRGELDDLRDADPAGYAEMLTRLGRFEPAAALAAAIRHGAQNPGPSVVERLLSSPDGPLDDLELGSVVAAAGADGVIAAATLQRLDDDQCAELKRSNPGLYWRSLKAGAAGWGR